MGEKTITYIKVEKKIVVNCMDNKNYAWESPYFKV